MKYTVEQYELDGELANYVSQPTRPRFDETAKLARQFLRLRGENPNDLLRFVTAVKALEQIYEDEGGG